MATLEVDTGYRPRPLQARLHRQLKRFNVLVCHRRFGKTVLSINELIDQALRCQRDRPRYAYIAPLYKQAKTVAWDYLKHFTRPIPGVTVNETELRVDLPGDRRIQLYGADNYDALRGIYLDGAVLDEYAQMAPKAWAEVIRPALADRKGFALFIGTPKGRNAFAELYDDARLGFRNADGTRMERDPEWYAELYRASETGALDPAELESARQQMSEEEYEQEFECSFMAALVGAYYTKQMATADREGRICDVPYDPALPVYSVWDLGVGDSTSIWWFQALGAEVRVIDFYEASGVGVQHYAEVCREKPWRQAAADFVPHDAKVREFTNDGRTRIETMIGLGLRPRLVPDHKVDDGINAARLLLARCWFDATRCAHGLECLRQYQREWDEQQKVFRPRPRHDWTSHAADAFRYLAMSWREARPEPPAKTKGKMLHEMTWNDLMAANKQQGSVRV